MLNKSSQMILYAVQNKEALDTIKATGANFVKEAYIRKKYQESAWSFLEAYRFFSQHMAKHIARPYPDAQFPIWLYASPSNSSLYLSQDSFLLKLKVPTSECILFDGRQWNDILNLRYVPRSEDADKERAQFEASLHSQGLHDTSQIFMSPFYPLLKREIQESWLRLFEDARLIHTGNLELDPHYLMAAVWELKEEWIEELITYLPS